MSLEVLCLILKISILSVIDKIVHFTIFFTHLYENVMYKLPHQFIYLFFKINAKKGAVSGMSPEAAPSFPGRISPV